MTPERYQALLRWLEARPALKKLVIALNRWLPAVPFACYPLLLVLLNVRWFRLLSANRAAALDFMQLIARAVFVPAFVFLGGTLLRTRLNFPRPYEQPGFTPLVPKETHGKSFPSRHAWPPCGATSTPPPGPAWWWWPCSSAPCGYLPGRTMSGMWPPVLCSALPLGPPECGCCDPKMPPAPENPKKFEIPLDRSLCVWYYTSRSVCRTHTAAR